MREPFGFVKKLLYIAACGALCYYTCDGEGKSPPHKSHMGSEKGCNGTLWLFPSNPIRHY